jgi:hypothetical protein
LHLTILLPWHNLWKDLLITFALSCKKSNLDLKTGKYHIVYAWILLTCFVAGQYMVYSHQHNITFGKVKTFHISKNKTQTTVKEKCELCDVMHHNVMVTTVQVYFTPVSAIGHVFKGFEYNFTSIQLILSCGRAPPVSNYKS